MAWWNRETDEERDARWAKAAEALPPIQNEADQTEKDAAATEALQKATQKAGKK